MLTKSGESTLGDQLRSVKRQTGKTPELLKIPPLPEELEHIWARYVDIKRGCDRINYESLNAYTNITKATLTQFETDCILKIDRKRIEVLEDG